MTEPQDEHFDAANECELDSQWAQANDHYTKAIELNPGFFEAYDNRAANWVELGNYADAVSDYHKVIELCPKYGEAHNNLARLYLEAGDPQFVDPKLARFHAKRACNLTQNNCYESLAKYARACLACRDFPNAVRLQQMAVNVATDMQSNSSADRVAQIDAEIMLPELVKRLESFRQAARDFASTSLLGRIRSWFKTSH